MADTDASRTGDSEGAFSGTRATETSRQVLVIVHPQCRAIDLPRPGTALGRSWLEDKAFLEPRVSQQHLLFLRKPTGLFVQDAGSTHGSWLNGVRLVPGEPKPLSDGVLRFGPVLAVYRNDFVGPDNATATPEPIASPFGFRRVFAMIDNLDLTRLNNVLIEGETGTGKELIAKEIARRFGRGGEKFVGFNVSAVPFDLFEPELFGRVQGAYTGATSAEIGYFMRADHGALLMDEINALPTHLQPKLLRVLQEREVTPVGSSKPRKFDALVMVSSNSDLDEDVECGRFKRDLYHRVAEVHIELPPLRERKEDIPAIVRQLRVRFGFAIDLSEANAAAWERLLVHPWRGNVRDLANTLRRMANLEPGTFRREGIDRVLGKLETTEAPKEPTGEDIVGSLARNGGNVSKTAREFEMSRQTVRRRRDQYNTEKEVDALLEGIGKRREEEEHE
jgi:transcriptional regulator with GAF, ATPase, and Fis domain